MVSLLSAQSVAVLYTVGVPGSALFASSFHSARRSPLMFKYCVPHRPLWCGKLMRFSTAVIPES